MLPSYDKDLDKTNWGTPRGCGIRGMKMQRESDTGADYENDSDGITMNIMSKD